MNSSTACLWLLRQKHRTSSWPLTWQQHSFLPDHSVKALRKSLDKIIGVCLSGCSVDFLCGDSFGMIGPISNIISNGAWKQYWLLQRKRWERCQYYILKSTTCFVSVLCVAEESSSWPGWLFQFGFWANRGSDLECHDHRWKWSLKKEREDRVSGVSTQPSVRVRILLLPASGSYNRSRSETKVDFPDPLDPTTAIMVPAGTWRLRSWKIGASLRVG